jgi:hypothetical protein
MLVGAVELVAAQQHGGHGWLWRRPLLQWRAN